MSTPNPNPPNPPTPNPKPEIPGGPSVQNGLSLDPSPFNFPNRIDPYQKEYLAVTALSKLMGQDIREAIAEGTITGVSVVFTCGIDYASCASWFIDQGSSDEKIRNKAEAQFLVRVIPKVFSMGREMMSKLNVILSGGKPG